MNKKETAEKILRHKYLRDRILSVYDDPKWLTDTLKCASGAFGSYAFSRDQEKRDENRHKLWGKIDDALYETVTDLRTARQDLREGEDNLSEDFNTRLRIYLRELRRHFGLWRDQVSFELKFGLGAEGVRVDVDGSQITLWLDANYLSTVIRTFGRGEQRSAFANTNQPHHPFLGMPLALPSLEQNKYLIGSVLNVDTVYDDRLGIDLNVWECDLVFLKTSNRNYGTELVPDKSREFVVFTKDITPLHATHATVEAAVKLYRRRRKARFVKEMDK